MCFIALTTPMTDIFIVLRQCRIPEVVIDLAMIIYRTIFIIVDQVQQIYNAQVMRLGYSTFRESIYSFASMCGAVFIASWNAGEDLIKAMDARCYDGKFALLGETRPVEYLPLFAVMVFLSLSSVIVFLSKDITII
jgi:cobalt/nickel transport system permease protein